MALGILPPANRGHLSSETTHPPRSTADGRAAAFRRALAALAVALVVIPGAPAVAQDTVVVRPGRPSRGLGVARWAVDRFNAPATIRGYGPFVVDTGEVLRGDVAVVDGPVTVWGTIRGDLVAINADLRLEAGSVVEGDVVVLGGVVDEHPDARVTGTLRRQSESLDLRRDGDRLVLQGRPPRTWDGDRGRDHPPFFDRARGRAFIVVGAGGTYNRVEGLPMRLGAGIEWTAGPIDGRLRGYGVFRTAGDFKGNRRDIGYQVEGELGLGHRPNLTVGGRAFDLVVPTQDWPLTRHEVGWASLLWHRDYRDYFLQRGLAAFVRLEPVSGFSLRGEVTRVDETSIAERDPWTLFRNAEAWRPNPIVDQGDFTLLTGAVEFDNREDHSWRAGGWLLRGTWEHGLGENVVERPLDGAIRDPLPATDYTFDRVSADLRRYQPVGWGGELRLRGFFAGAVGDGALPVQRRYSLGGPDPMNGYAFRSFACNAGVDDPAMPGLCDRVLLFQAQYRGGFGFDWLDFDRPDRPDRRGRGWDRDWDWDWDGDWFDFDGPSLVFFTNAGTAWLASRSDGIPSLSWDVGAGIEMGSIGLYAAKAIREGEPIRLTFRVERRF
jgi:hypothetical protein